MSEKLTPCPFCGGKPYFYEIYSAGRKVWKVMCGERVDCCAILNEWATQEEAAQAWNKRNITSSAENGELLKIVQSLAESDNYPRDKEVKQAAKKLIQNMKME